MSCLILMEEVKLNLSSRLTQMGSLICVDNFYETRQSEALAMRVILSQGS